MTFLEVIREQLIEMKAVRLDGLGELHIAKQRGRVDMLHPRFMSGPITATSKKKYHVYFKKSQAFTRMLRARYGGAELEIHMEKYGVDEAAADNEKKASDGCPVCGKPAERHGNVLACPTHGTEPFEQKE